MDSPWTVLLIADVSLIRSLLHEILASHGFKVLVQAEDTTSEGNAHAGHIDLLVADIDKGGLGKGQGLAENLGYLRTEMHVLFFRQSSKQLWLLKNPATPEEIRIAFTPWNFLEWTTGILSGGFSESFRA